MMEVVDNNTVLKDILQKNFKNEAGEHKNSAMQESHQPCNHCKEEFIAVSR
jgi:hypothetical protein